jgi:hypothetical protein
MQGAFELLIRASTVFTNLGTRILRSVKLRIILEAVQSLKPKHSDKDALLYASEHIQIRFTEAYRACKVSRAVATYLCKKHICPDGSQQEV